MRKRYDFSAAIGRAIENSGMTQSALSEKTGITQKSLSFYVNGHTEPTLTNAVLIANALDISLDELIGRRRRVDKEASYIENVYQSLNDRGKASLHEQAEMHDANPLYKKRDSAMETA